ncbi:MAG: cupin domain-containing protein [Alphaproteobacteria bacterium]
MSRDEASPQKPALNPATLEPHVGSSYPESFRAAVAEREKRALSDALGLSKFGVNLVRLPPGCASSQRHWHSKEDEFVYVLDGEVTLLTDAGPQVLTAGMVAGFPAGRADGHQLVNRSDRDALYLEVGDRNADDEVIYPDIDLRLRAIDGKHTFTHKDGTPY